MKLYNFKWFKIDDCNQSPTKHRPWKYWWCAAHSRGYGGYASCWRTCFVGCLAHWGIHRVYPTIKDG